MDAMTRRAVRAAAAALTGCLLFVGYAKGAVQQCPNGNPATPYVDMVPVAKVPAANTTVIYDLQNPVVRMRFSKQINPASVTDSPSSNQTAKLREMVPLAGGGTLYVPIPITATVTDFSGRPAYTANQTPIAGIVGDSITIKPNGPLKPNTRYQFLFSAAPRDDDDRVITTSNANGTLGIEGVQVNCVEWPILWGQSGGMFYTGNGNVCGIASIPGSGFTSVNGPVPFTPGRRYDIEYRGYIPSTGSSSANDRLVMTTGGIPQWSETRAPVLESEGDVGVIMRMSNVRYVPASDCNGGTWVAQEVKVFRWENVASGPREILKGVYNNRTIPSPSTCQLSFYNGTVQISAHAGCTGEYHWQPAN
ncbi:MAG: Ig-like domain-containing protein [Moraxellaceae bacterium]|nr:Ig-like domain-containing protein [Moraxellaceae bacterium]